MTNGEQSDVRARLRWWHPTRHRIRTWGCILMLVGATLMLAVWFAPGKYRIGPLKFSLRTVRNPSMAFMLGAFMWYGCSVVLPTSVDRLRRAIVGTWVAATRRQRLWYVLATTQVLFLLQNWLGFPEHVLSTHHWNLVTRTQPSFADDEGKEYANLDYFAALCRHELPRDARILFHGYIEGLPFAYEVYPQRVFMLPREYYDIAKSWHKQRWLEGMPEDLLESFWHQGFPTEFEDDKKFIEEHGITHEVWFDEVNPTACRWRELR